MSFLRQAEEEGVAFLPDPLRENGGRPRPRRCDSDEPSPHAYERGRSKDEARIEPPAHIELPLAAAYHQRASRAAADLDLDQALRDADPAVMLNPVFLPYVTTYAVLLDRLAPVLISRYRSSRRGTAAHRYRSRAQRP